MNVNTAVLTLIFLVMSGVLGVLIKGVGRWARLETVVSDLLLSKENEHKLIREEINGIRAQMREDRAASNERLTWLEHNRNYEPRHTAA